MVVKINYFLTKSSFISDLKVISSDLCKVVMGGIGGPEQQYSLRWNDFHASILSSFRHLRDQEDFVDVTLACDGCSFTAHKVVLSACSPYFRTLLKVSFKEFYCVYNSLMCYLYQNFCLPKYLFVLLKS